MSVRAILEDRLSRFYHIMEFLCIKKEAVGEVKLEALDNLR